MSQVNTLKEIALSRAIDGQLNDIVRATGALAIRLKDTQMGKSQLRNVLNAAMQTRSIEVVNNFIHYQISREKGWRSNDFGEKLISALSSGGTVHVAAMAAAREASDYLKNAVPAQKLSEEEIPSTEMLAQDAYVRLSRLFLGYLNRWFQFGQGSNWDRIKSILPDEWNAQEVAA